MAALPAVAAADYIGPEEILSGSWGAAENQFGSQRAIMCDNNYHPLLAVMPDGSLYVNDIGNHELKVYKNGVLRKQSPSNCDTIRLMGLQGLEEGREVESERVSEYFYRATVAFQDATYTLNHRSGKYFRDRDGNIYGLSYTEVKRYDRSGALVGNLSVRYGAVYSDNSVYNVVEPGGRTSSQYQERATGIGNLVLGPDGNVYCWKWSPDKLSILKWTWRDAQELYGLPDTPRYVEAHPTPNGIAVRWWFPFQNKDSITAFEILRTEKSGTPPYRSVGVVQRKDITGFTFFEDTSAKKGVTYYYRMRTIAGDNYSVYSNEAIGRR